MKIAVCAHDMDERHYISRLLDETLPARGLIPKISLFPLLNELLESAAKPDRPFDVAILSGHKEDALLQQLCRLTPVILVGQQEMAPVAFDVGAAYFIEAPADPQKLERAIAHYIQTRYDQSTAPRWVNRFRQRY